MRRAGVDNGRCSCGLRARFAVHSGCPTTMDGDGGTVLQLCHAHHKVWTVDRLRARLPPARLALAESDDLIAAQNPAGVVSMDTMDDDYFRRHFKGGR